MLPCLASFASNSWKASASTKLPKGHACCPLGRVQCCLLCERCKCAITSDTQQHSVESFTHAQEHFCAHARIHTQVHASAQAHAHARTKARTHTFKRSRKNACLPVLCKLPLLDMRVCRSHPEGFQANFNSGPSQTPASPSPNGLKSAPPRTRSGGMYTDSHMVQGAYFGLTSSPSFRY